MEDRTRLAEAIVQPLQEVARERAVRDADPALAARVQAVKHYQQLRFQRTYADLLASPRYAAAARFFLDELYGSADFTRRDDQFLRIVPALTRLFPHEIVETVVQLAQLHALTESLDTALARQLASTAIDPAAYVAAWQATGAPAGRERQIVLTLQVGSELDRLTRRAMLLTTLRMMRGPAWRSCSNSWRPASPPSRTCAARASSWPASAHANAPCALRCSTPRPPLRWPCRTAAR